MIHEIFKQIKKRPWILKLLVIVLIIGIFFIFIINFLLVSLISQAASLINGEKEAKQTDVNAELTALNKEHSEEFFNLYLNANKEFYVPWSLLMATHSVKTDFETTSGFFRNDAMDLPNWVWEKYKVSKREIDYEHEIEKKEKELEEIYQRIYEIRDEIQQAAEEQDVNELESELEALEEQAEDLQEEIDEMNAAIPAYLPNRDRVDDVIYTLAHFLGDKGYATEEEIFPTLSELGLENREIEEIKILWWLYGTSYGSVGVAGWPVPEEYGLENITSPFGYRIHPVTGVESFHNGVDIGAPLGTPIFAIQDGVVSYAGSANGYGTLIIIDHEDGMQSYYGHSQTLYVTEGQEVSAGEQIAEMGSEGVSTGSHLHIEIRIDNVPVDPMNYLVIPGTESEG